MNEEQALHELEFIKKVMNDSKRVVVDNGLGYIMWGSLIVLGFISTYFMLYFKVGHFYGLNWIVLIAIGWIFSAVGSKKEREKRKTTTFAEKILAAIWFSSGVAMTIVGFAGAASGKIGGFFISPVIAVILGIAFFISGYVYGAKWITLLSVAWWAGAVVMFLLPGIQVLWIMPLMLILFQIIPGIILFKQAKKELAKNG